jgi:hypothetical protein
MDVAIYKTKYNFVYRWVYMAPIKYYNNINYICHYNKI